MPPAARQASAVVIDPSSPKVGFTREPVALFGLWWNTHVEVHMPLRDREWDPTVQLLLRRTITRHIHDTNKLESFTGRKEPPRDDNAK